MAEKRIRKENDTDVSTATSTLSNKSQWSSQKDDLVEYSRKTVNNLKETLQCPICQDFLCRPVSLSCGHNLCTHCSKQWFIANNDKKLRCPTCRKGSYTLHDLNPNLSLEKTLETFFSEDYQTVLKDLDKEEAITKKMEQFGKSEEYSAIARVINDVMISEMEERLIYTFHQIYTDIIDNLVEHYESINRLASELPSYSRDDPMTYLKLYYVWRRESSNSFFYGPYLDPGSSLDLVDPSDIDDDILEKVTLIQLLGHHTDRSFTDLRKRLRSKCKFPVDLSKIDNFNIWTASMENILRLIVTKDDKP